MRGVFWRPQSNFKQEAGSQINSTRYPWKQRRASRKISKLSSATFTEKLKISGGKESWFHVGKVIGRGSSKVCKAKGSLWFWRWFPVPNFNENTFSAEEQVWGQFCHWGSSQWLCIFIQPLWRVLLLFKPWEGLGFTEQETLSSSCGWKLGHALILCLHTMAELRTLPSFLGSKTKFFPLNPCKGDHLDKKNPQADVYP